MPCMRLHKRQGDFNLSVWNGIEMEEDERERERINRIYFLITRIKKFLIPIDWHGE